jgi:hypothetical protein
MGVLRAVHSEDRMEGRKEGRKEDRMGVQRVVRSEGRMGVLRVGPRAVRSEDRMEGRKEDLMGVLRVGPRAVRSEGLVPQVGEVEGWTVLQGVIVAAWAAWAVLLEERSTARVLFLAQGLGSLRAA